MAERNQKVYERVRQELQKNPGAGSRELYEMAQQVDKGIGQETLQQFHARYFLPVKREQAADGGATRPRRRRPKAAAADGAEKPARRGARRGRGRAAGSERDQVRSVLLQFAQDFSAAETKPEIVEVMSRMDDYIDRITGSS